MWLQGEEGQIGPEDVTCFDILGDTSLVCELRALFLDYLVPSLPGGTK